MNEWHIQSRSHTCQNCSHGFREGVAFHTLLFDDKKDFLRMEICTDCWNQQFKEARDRRGFVSHWQGAYEPPPLSAPEPIQKATAEGLLRKLMELNDPKYLAASYILAVMLERKRILRVKEQIRSGGRRTFVYEHPKTGDFFTIPDPDLQLNQLEEVQRMVGELLEHGLTPAILQSAPALETSATPVEESSFNPEPEVLAEVVVAAEP